MRTNATSSCSLISTALVVSDLVRYGERIQKTFRLFVKQFESCASPPFSFFHFPVEECFDCSFFSMHVNELDWVQLRIGDDADRHRPFLLCNILDVQGEKICIVMHHTGRLMSFRHDNLSLLVENSTRDPYVH
jgi:hypothetical protein